MIEVPGMTRPALDAMAPQDVEALRWAIYARALAPIVRTDYDQALTDLSDAESPPKSGALQARRSVQRERLTQGKIQQAEIRALLLLDGEDDDA